MAVTDKTRKLLWGRSGNRCAHCRRELIIEATETDDESIVGEECHIHSPKQNGPRFDPAISKEELDKYPNLLLLCRNHHKMIDDQTNSFSAQDVRKIKSDHENWVTASLDLARMDPEVQARAKTIDQFIRLKNRMGDLLSEMAEDLSTDTHYFTREFFLLQKNWVFNFQGPYLAYHFYAHENLQGKIHVLENLGYVSDETVTNVKKYRFSEEFVSLLRDFAYDS